MRPVSKSTKLMLVNQSVSYPLNQWASLSEYKPLLFSQSSSS